MKCILIPFVLVYIALFTCAAHATCRGYPDYGCDSVDEWANTYNPPSQYQGGQFNQNNSARAQQMDNVQQRVMRRGF